MSKNLLHKNKLEAFKAWLDANHIEWRPGRGNFQVIQIKTKNGHWQCVFDRCYAPEHYTVAWPLESVVHRFIKDNRNHEHVQRSTSLGEERSQGNT